MSKGGSTSTKVEVPKYIEDAAKRNLTRAEGIAGLGYVPYYGADVAAFTPMQEAAFGSTNMAAGAFGMPTVGASQLTGMPEAETFAGGMRGYSSAPMYEQSLQELQANRPGQYEYMQGFFIDPITGERGSMMGDPVDYTTGEEPITTTGGFDTRGYADDRDSVSSAMGTNAGYISFGDMFDGGGPGQSGDKFGGALGGLSNSLGLTPGDFGQGDSGGGEGGEGGDSCVIATHAVSSGGFTPQMKREAVVWCMHNLHDKWWGEAIRRGYRYLGNQKIEQGKAHEHYQEFRDYIAFANGKKRTLLSAIKFTLRTAQFFAVGMIKKDA